MILDLEQFIARERPLWEELEAELRADEERPDRQRSVDEVQRFHYLYQRAASDLVRMQTFAAHGDLQSWLENLVARGYARLHDSRGGAGEVSGVAVWQWLSAGFPRACRRRWRAGLGAVICLAVGLALGGLIQRVSPDAAADLLGPFGALASDPVARVAAEEGREFDFFAGRRSFSSQLMVNNIRVAFLAMALGLTFGLGTCLLLFHNGVLIGLVATAYVRAGEGTFLLAWLLPHGSFELPAVCLGGAAGLVLARAMFGWRSDVDLRERLRRSLPDMLSLAIGAALMLVWAALVEAFLSQYHAPELYPWKIAFGSVQLAVLALYLSLAGRRGTDRRGVEGLVRFATVAPNGGGGS